MDEIKVEVWVKVVVFEQTLCEGVLSPLFECIMGMDSVTEECVPYPALHNRRPVNLPSADTDWELVNCLSPHRLLI